MDILGRLAQHRWVRNGGKRLRIPAAGLAGRKIPDFGNKAIATPDQSLDIARTLGVVFQNLPYFSDRCVYAVIGVEKNVFAPNSLDNLLSCDQLSAFFHQ